MADERNCLVYDLGFIDYKEAWDLQLQLVKKRQENRIPDTLLLLQHPPVITQGRGSKPEHLLVSPKTLDQQNISLYSIERGGDITYHGPGQLVGYPILDLKQHGQDLGLYLREIEEVVIRTLACYNISGVRRPGHTGVWVESEKICAIGIAVKRWVSYHGFALNLNPNMEHFRLIVPCGIRDAGVTSLSRILKRPLDETIVKKQIVTAFAEIFNLKIIPVDDRNMLEHLLI